MKTGKRIASLCCMLLSLSCSFNKLAKTKWQITYRRVEYFFGSELLQIGTDSCYYESQAVNYKNQPIIRWNATKKELGKLYKLIDKFKMQEASPLSATVTEQPFENLELLQNDRVIFSVIKHQQTEEHRKKFDELVSILKSFALK
ncbi:MAG: hypothetical protein QM687_06235 [Ferruginibacter sp.]